MTETIADRVRRYVLDGSDDDLRRLLKISEVSSDMARSAFQRVGLERGWRVVDCGCGPIGGMAVLADLVGPTGRVVGIDFNEAALHTARSVCASLGLENVELVCSALEEVDVDGLGGPFDLVYTRCFLMHQPDAPAVLARMSDLVRPGGWIVAQEPLRSPAPRSQPDLAPLRGGWELMYEAIERSGVAPNAVEGLPRAADGLGLQSLTSRVWSTVMAPELGFELHAATLVASRQRALEAGVATAAEVDSIVADLRDARTGSYDWVTTPFYLDLAMQRS